MFQSSQEGAFGRFLKWAMMAMVPGRHNYNINWKNTNWHAIQM